MLCRTAPKLFCLLRMSPGRFKKLTLLDECHGSEWAGYAPIFVLFAFQLKYMSRRLGLKFYTLWPS